jgi:hypothetical protein
VQQLQEMQNDLAAYYVLGNDIDASETQSWNGGEGFVPVGTVTGDANDAFTGKFDGRGHLIDGLHINRVDGTSQGLFGYIHSGGVRNLHLSNAEVTADFRSGILAGAASTYSTITNCSSTGTLTLKAGTAGSKSGGLAGFVNAGTHVSHCSSGVSVNAGDRRQVGGLIGVVEGRSYYTLLDNSYSTGTVTGGGSKQGNLVGDADGCHVDRCYSCGYGKALIGHDWESPVITNSYWDSEKGAPTSSNGGTPKTTAQMMQEATFVGWDFVNTWDIVENETYPFFRNLFCGGMGVPTIGVSPQRLEFSAYEAGSNPAPQLLTVRNIGGDMLNWQISEDCDWLSIDPESGSLAAGQAAPVALFVDISGLEGGAYSCPLIISDPCACNSPYVVHVDLLIFGAEIELSAQEFSFMAHQGAANAESQVLTVGNSGLGTLNWTISHDCGWLTVEPNSGSCDSGEGNDVTLSVDISSVPQGIYDCTLLVSDANAVNNPQAVDVGLRVFMGLIDYGDAPEEGTSYATTLARDAARHYLDFINGPTVFLGETVDEELEGQPSVDADGDDANYMPDEDGVLFRTRLVPGATAEIEVVASANGLLDAWIDFNADGDWADANEQIFVSEPLSAGSNLLTFGVPSDASLGDTYARFRFSTAGGLYYSAVAADGEVEDYVVQLVECLGASDPGYGRWVSYGRPDCWCYRKQCRGDADGLRLGGVFPVSLDDLHILRGAINKMELPPGGECADFDHKALGGIIPVSLDDVMFIRMYLGQLDMMVPECDQPPASGTGPYNFWTEP